MPPGTPFNAFIPPYPIRIDEFTSLPPTAPQQQPLLHLLTHAHSDHTLGLAAKSFGYPVICSADTKEMLLRHEVYKERELLEAGVRAEKVRTYGHLKVGDVESDDVGVKRDLLREIPLNTPRRVQLNSEEVVVVTAIDANHCPGSVMYLIEGAKGAILHTGDVRVEPWFIESLKHNPYLQPYLYPSPSASGSESTISKTLEAIYLDTACVFTTFAVSTKEEAVEGLIELMKLYPDDTHFFLNCWTWGYEDVLKGVARAFQSKIHLDRYKHTILSRLSDPFLRSIITRDEDTRFHACERFGRCASVQCDSSSSASSSASRPSTGASGKGDEGDVYIKRGKAYSSRSITGKKVVYVNPVTMGAASWKLYLQEVKAAWEEGESVDCFLVPLSRHSPLPELQSLVNLFRPKRIVPNTLDPSLAGLDWAAIDVAFSPYLHPTSSALSSFSSNSEWKSFLAPMGFTKPHIDPHLIDRLVGVDMEEERDAAVKNLAGTGGEKELVERWADSGKVGRKVGVIKGILSAASSEASASPSATWTAHPTRDSTSNNNHQILGTTSSKPNWLDTELHPNHASQSQIYERDEETQESQLDDEEAHERTARLLFCSDTQEWGALLGEEERRLQEEGELAEAEKEEKEKESEKGEGREGMRWMGQLTPVSSPAAPACREKGKGKQSEEEREEVTLDSQGYNPEVNVPLVFVKVKPRKREGMGVGEKKPFDFSGFAEWRRGRGGEEDEEDEEESQESRKSQVNEPLEFTRLPRKKDKEEPLNKIPLMNMNMKPDKTPVTGDELKVPCTPGKGSERRFGTPDTATPAVLDSSSDSGPSSAAFGRGRRSPLKNAIPMFPLYDSTGERREEDGDVDGETREKVRALESPVKISSSTMRTHEAPAEFSKMRTLDESPVKPALGPAKHKMLNTPHSDTPLPVRGRMGDTPVPLRGMHRAKEGRSLASPICLLSSSPAEEMALFSRTGTPLKGASARKPLTRREVKNSKSPLVEVGNGRTIPRAMPEQMGSPLKRCREEGPGGSEPQRAAKRVKADVSAPVKRGVDCAQSEDRPVKAEVSSPLTSGNSFAGDRPATLPLKRGVDSSQDRPAKRVHVSSSSHSAHSEHSSKSHPGSSKKVASASELSSSRSVDSSQESPARRVHASSSSGSDHAVRSSKKVASAPELPFSRGIDSSQESPAKRLNVSSGSGSAHSLRAFKSQPGSSKKDTRRPTLCTSISADAIPPKSTTPSEAELTLLRIQIGEKLEKAFPKEILAPAEKRRAKREALYARYFKLRAKEQYAAMGVVVHPCVPKEEEKDSGDSVGEEEICVADEDDHAGVDWDRSRRIAEAARHALEYGRRPTFPALVCLETQDSKLGSQ